MLEGFKPGGCVLLRIVIAAFSLTHENVHMSLQIFEHFQYMFDKSQDKLERESRSGSCFCRSGTMKLSTSVTKQMCHP